MKSPFSNSGAVTLQRVASAAGVTLSTASRSLNNAYGVHPDTRAHVLRVAERLKYKPNRLARGLVTGRSHMIGLIVSDIRNPYFAEVARGAEDAAYAAGCDLMLCNSDLDPTKQMRYIDSLMEKRVEGIIMNSVAPLTGTEQAYLARSGIPVVLLNRRTRGTLFSTVSADNERGGELAASCLLQHGHRNIVHLTGPKQHANLALRGRGFTRTVEQFGRGAKVTVINGHHTLTGGYDMARNQLSTNGGFTAIFAASDVIALGVIRASLELGIRIPDDVSLIGFDDVEVAALVSPPLTTIRQPSYDIGSIAVEILLRVATRRDCEPEHRLLGVQLIERASVSSISTGRPRRSKGL